jgi:hypothetical protein
MNVSRIAALVVAVGCATGAGAQTIRENEFFFSVPDLNQGFYFELKQYSVTKDQPWDGVQTSIDTRQHYAWIYVMSGRKGSKEVADWFRAQVGLGSAQGANTSAQWPEELNFAIRGNLTIKAGNMQLVCKDVVIAQGNRALFWNNWWVGGPGMKTVNDNGRGLLQQSCEGGTMKTGSGQAQFSNNFDLYVNGL